MFSWTTSPTTDALRKLHFWGMPQATSQAWRVGFEAWVDKLIITSLSVFIKYFRSYCITDELLDPMNQIKSPADLKVDLFDFFKDVFV